eukprot:m.301646 g.301646  ORF g.301646 m.301646 type:complete len:122 (-) comp20143_c0_seq7:422-787(-)
MLRSPLRLMLRGGTTGSLTTSLGPKFRSTRDLRVFPGSVHPARCSCAPSERADAASCVCVCVSPTGAGAHADGSGSLGDERVVGVLMCVREDASSGVSNRLDISLQLLSASSYVRREHGTQ